METPRILLATNRPSVETFFDEYRGQSPVAFALVSIPLDETRLDQFTSVIEQADAAVIDIGGDPDGGVRVCNALRTKRSELRIVAIVCCPKPTFAWHIQALIDTRVNEVLDAEATPSEIFAALQMNEILDGTRIRLQRPYAGSGSAATAATADDRVLLGYVARGWSDQRLGTELHLSARAIRARLERLRFPLGVTTREELAAWAGAHGLYHPPFLQTAGA